MNLVFDIDDTITNETGFMIKYAPKYLKKKYKYDFFVQNPYGENLSEVFGVSKFLEEKGYSKSEIEKEVNEVNSKFWTKYFIKYIFYPLKQDASKIINKLKEKGYKINFVSLRGIKTHNDENNLQKFIRKSIVPFITKIQLKLNRIKYDKLILVEKNEEKLEIARKLNANYVFDDNIEVLKSLDESMIAICIEAPHNIKIDLSQEKIARIPFKADSIEDIIRKSNKQKKLPKFLESKQNEVKELKLYQKVYTELFYKLIRGVGKNQVIKTFKPIVLGEENIPTKKEATVFIGNHRDVKDPLITISFLKNPVHFAALKRMFEYNENIFGPVGKNIGTVATTLFVKSIGALPIARPNNENYIFTNLQTFKYIEDYLNANSSIAIYPEGTLNRNPDQNGNILPLKSLYSFQIAENGKAVVRPISIVWIPKNVKSDNRVIISFLKPIYTNGLKSKEIAEIWKKSVNESIEAINEMIEKMERIETIAIEENQEKSKDIKILKK